MKRLLTSCFGLGWLPVAPGTWGSVPTVVIFMLLGYLCPSAAVTAIVMGTLVVVGSVICVKFASAAMEATGRKDPSEVVIDEFAGQAMTFLVAGTIATNQICGLATLGFLLFRFFDIVKPSPVRNFEKLNGGWGILADDLAAGVYAGIVLLVCYYSGLMKYLGW